MGRLTPFGFFNVVEKPDDQGRGAVTVRADLAQLKTACLPALGEIFERTNTDTRYRVKAPRGELAVTMANIVMDLDYSNFKNEVKAKQGATREGVFVMKHSCASVTAPCWENTTDE